MTETNQQAQAAETQIHVEPKNNAPATTTSALDFLQKNRQLVTYVIGGILLLIAGVFAYNYFIIKPQEAEAEEAIVLAELAFERDSLNMALSGGPNFMGMQAIADEYGATETGELASYYTGIILMQKGQYEEAIEYLKDFSTRSKVHEPLRLGLIGDAYSQLKNYEEAADYYHKAATASDNEFTSSRFWFKAGLVNEQLGNYDAAIEAYKTIKEKYPKSQQATTIDKYLARAQAKANEFSE